MFRRLPEPAVAPVSITIDGMPVEAREGDSVAAALLAAGHARCRSSSVSDAPRGPYCMMGVCFDCLAIVDGVASVQTCLTPVRDGMSVERQRGRPEAA